MVLARDEHDNSVYYFIICILDPEVVKLGKRAVVFFFLSLHLKNHQSAFTELSQPAELKADLQQNHKAICT